MLYPQGDAWYWVMKGFGDFPGVAAPCISASACLLLGLQYMPSFQMGQELWDRRGRAGGGTRIPGRQGWVQLSPRSQGMSGLGWIQSTVPLDFLKTWRMSGQATARDWPTGTADQQLTPSHSVRQPGEGRGG